MLGQFFGSLGVQVGEGVAALLAEHVFGAVEPVGGPDGKVLVDEGAGAAVLAGERVVYVPQDNEGGLEDIDEGVTEDARCFAEAVDPAVVRVVGGQSARVGQEGGDVVGVGVGRYVRRGLGAGGGVGSGEAAGGGVVLAGVEVEVAGGGFVAGAGVGGRAGGGAAGDGAQDPGAERVVGPALIEGAGAVGDVDRGALGVVVVVEERTGAGLDGGGLAEGVVAEGLLDGPGAVVFGGVWARKRGTVRRAGVEGTGTFGAGLSRYLMAQRIQVFEVNRPDRSARRLLGKSDPLDAQAAARAVLSGRARARAKSGDGPVHSARIYKLAKDSAVKARTQAINQLKAVLVIADPALRERLSSLGDAELFRTCATLSPHDGGGDEDAVTQATHMTLRMLAERIEQLTGQINELNQRLTRLVEHHAPQPLVPVGIGPDSAVTLLITLGDNPERLNSEASFAALCGVSPIEYSSGRRSTRRLNHGGDRQANAALHRIVFTRLRHDPRTQEYYERRTREGKTRREIIRCLKRYAAREVFNLVRPASRTPAL